MDEKNNAPAMPRQDAPITVNLVNSIPQPGALAQPSAPQIPSKKSKRERHTLGIDSKVHAVAIKCYDEQLLYGRDYTFSAIQQTDKSQFQVLAIVHDRDTVTAGIWLEAAIKSHLHIIVRCVDRKKRIRVRTIMDCLGIFFRPGLDDTIWQEHGVETISRFFVCALQSNQGTNHLALCSPSTRGSEQEQLERAEMFAEFAERFNDTIASYTPAADGDNTLDLIATLDPFDSFWDKLEAELTAWEASKEPSDDTIDAYVEYQARKELGEPVTFDGSAVCLPPWYEKIDWCNPDHSPERREELRQRQLTILADWNRKKPQAVETAQEQQQTQPQQGLYNPPDRQY